MKSNGMEIGALRAVAVYCGSSPGNDPVFAHAAVTAGQALARRGIRVIYGGGGVGLMGALADTVLAAGGQITGVIPHFLDTRELKHPGVKDMRVVATMHERKLMMVEESQAFLALPGGYGTLDELFEVLTWAQLRLHQHPVGLLNVRGFFDPQMAFLDGAVAAGFLSRQDRDRLLMDSEMENLLERLANWQPPADTKFHLARRVEL